MGASPRRPHGPLTKLALDHHYSLAIAQQPRERNHDVVAAIERNWHGDDDETLLEACVGERRALLTNNLRDFAVIARAWTLEDRSHHGLIFTSDTSMPRSRDTNGTYTQALDKLLGTHLDIDAPKDQIWWL